MGRRVDNVTDLTTGLQMSDQLLVVRPGEFAGRAPMTTAAALIGAASSAFFFDLGTSDAGFIRVLPDPSTGHWRYATGTGLVPAVTFESRQIAKPDAAGGGYLEIFRNAGGFVDFRDGDGESNVTDTIDLIIPPNFDSYLRAYVNDAGNLDFMTV